jgi:hypothetical protein
MAWTLSMIMRSDPEKALNLPPNSGRKQAILDDLAGPATCTGPLRSLPSPKSAQPDLIFR